MGSINKKEWVVMKRHKIVLILVISIIIGCTYAAFGGMRQSGSKQGIVFYNWTELKPPFEFTWRGDTLCLNGIPFSPYRKIKKIEKRLKYVPSGQRIEQNHLAKIVLKESKRGKSMKERLDIMSKLFLKSSLVDSIKISGNTVFVYWKDSPIFKFEGFTLSNEPLLSKSALDSLKLVHSESKKKDFWYAYNNGGIFVFGDIAGYIVAPSSEVEKTREAYEKLKRGNTLTAEERKGTVFSNNSLYKLIKP